MVSKAGEGFLRDLRTRVFDHLQRLSMPFYDREKAGVLVSRMTSDVDSLAELVQMGLVMFAMNTLLLVFSLIVLVIVSWQLALVCLIALPFVVLASIRFQRESNRAYLTIRDRIGHTLSRLQEGISGVRVIQAYGRESTEIERFNVDSRDLYDAHMRSVRAQAWYLPVIEFAGLGTTALVVGIGGWMAIDGRRHHRHHRLLRAHPGQPVRPGAAAQPAVQHGADAPGPASRSCSSCSTPRSTCPSAPAPSTCPATGEIVVDHVSFAYAGSEPVLRDVDLTIAPGRAAGPGRADRCRQVDAGQARRPALRPDRGRGALRRHRPARRHPALAARAHRGRAPGGLPVQRHDPRQHPHRPG